MKATFVSIVAALAALASAQDLSGLPKCATECLTSSGGLSSSGCNGFQIDCICKNSDFISKLACCVSQKCSKDDQATVVKFANGICAQAKVTLPSSASCAAGSGAAKTGSAAASGSNTMMAPGSGGMASGSGSSGASATGSGSMASGTAASAGSSGSATGSAGAAASTGAAAHLAVQGAGVVGGLAAAVAVLL